MENIMETDEIIRKAIGVFYDRIVTDEDWKKIKTEEQIQPVLEVCRLCIDIINEANGR